MPDPREARRAVDKLHNERLQTLAYRNDSSEDVPPYGLLRITGADYSDDLLTFLTINKPNTTFQRFYAVNGPSLVPAGQYGTCSLGFGSVLMVAIDTGTPAYGEGWGAKPASWKLNKNYPGGGFTVIGGNNTDKGTSLFVQQPVNSLIGVLNGALAEGASVSVSVWRGAGGSEADETNWDITAYDYLMKTGATNIASGKKCLLQFVNGVWYVTNAECA